MRPCRFLARVLLTKDAGEARGALLKLSISSSSTAPPRCKEAAMIDQHRQHLLEGMPTRYESQGLHTSAISTKRICVRIEVGSAHASDRNANGSLHTAF